MKQEFEMTQEEMDHIIHINKTVNSPVMLVGGHDMSSYKQGAINNYWAELGKKYNFKPMTVEGSSRGKLFFLAEPIPPPPPPKTQTEIETEKYIGESLGYLNYNVCQSLSKIVAQLESCNYETEAGSLNNNVAFLSLKRMANSPIS